MAERRYDDREVSALIKRAAELQAESSDNSSDLPTLGQVQQAASELGIRQEFLERAASELSEIPKRKGILGGEMRNRRTATVQGRLRPDRWPMVLHRMRDLTNRVGQPLENADSFEWISRQPDKLHVSIVPDGVQTRISVQSDISDWLVLFCVFPFPFALIAAAVMKLTLGWVGLAIWFGIFAAILLGEREMFSRMSRRRSKLIDQLIQSIESEVDLLAKSKTDSSISNLTEPDSHLTLGN
jgi:hypothetical protein